MSEAAASPKTSSGRVPRIVVVMVIAWFLACLAGSFLLLRYKQTPGAPTVKHETWPAGLEMKLDPTRPTLVMAVHPKCSCSRASVSELAQIMDRVGDRVSARVLFIRPKGVDDGWEKTELYERVRKLRGVEVIIDKGGAEAAHFGAVTSGQVYLYGVDGKLQFAGGVTSARGHEGESEGRSAVIALVDGMPAGVPKESNVYGCELSEQPPARTAAAAAMRQGENEK